MVDQSVEPTLREAVAVFDDEEELRKAIFELESAGFDRADVSILPPMEAVRRKIGHELYRVEDAEDDPEMPRAVPVGPAGMGAAQGALSAFTAGMSAGRRLETRKLRYACDKGYRSEWRGLHH